MKHIFFILFIFITSTTYADSDYSGIWKDNKGLFYSIHQSNDSIVITELHSNKVILSHYERGSIVFTNNELDLAITGYGFFILELEDGTHAYTRNGKFHLSSNNEIVNDRGERLLTEKQLRIPNTITGTRTIIIKEDGSINLHNPESGDTFKLDRILLAGIPYDKIKFSGYPITLEDQQSASYLYPGDISQGVTTYYIGLIQQGALESLSYDLKTWKGRHGYLISNKAKLSLITESYPENSMVKDIYFDSDTTATIKNECKIDSRVCVAFDLIQERQLTKVY